GYGSYGGILITVGVSDSNIWGSGIGMSLNLEKSEVSKSASISVTNSRLNDSDFSGSFSLFNNDMDYYDYRVMSKGFTLGTGLRFTRHISGSLSYGYSDNRYDIVDLNNTYLDPRFLESYAKGSITVGVKFDNTDDYYLPRTGFSLSQSIEKAGIGGDVNFIKSRTDFGAFKGLERLLGIDAIARYKARLYYLINSGDGILPLSEKFYMGGIGSVRGYQSYSISPTQISTDGSVIRSGGAKTFSNSIELSFPLIPKAKMRLVTFVDYGFIGDNSFTEYSRAGYGVGLEWFSPVGPIQLVLAQPLLEETGDRTSAFEFTMGQRF
ncbi:BamA/TamA family outer membrane protein, partial [Sulfurimonas sp. SAG-AH-194-I05]